MSELHRDEQLTTADIVNRPRTGAALQAVPDFAFDPRNGLDTSQAGPFDTQEPRTNALFLENELHNFRSRWDQVQTSFVDEPRTAVEQADSLVANVVKHIAEQFACEREQLEKQWDRGENVNTEDLRQAFKRYRAFFDRLLSF